VLTAAYAVLWIGGILINIKRYSVPPGLAWTAPAFLALAGAITLLGTRRPIRLALAGAAGYGLEVVGVHTGVPFGRYTYTETLGLQLLGVPVVLACAWLVLVSYVTDRVRRAIRRAAARPVLGALWLVATDLLIDPLAAGPLTYWRWAGNGSYYGVPWSNFVGWFLTGVLLVALVSDDGGQAERAAAWTGLSVIVFFGITAAAYGLLAPALVALALLGAHVATENLISARS
jgi:putative membrane protein